VENDKCEKQAIRTEKVQKKECKRGLPLFRICGAYFFFHFFVRCFLAFFSIAFFPIFLTVLSNFHLPWQPWVS
jgi:hypothetical protein